MIDFARRVAEEAGRILMSRLGRLGRGDVTNKGRVDLVTAADHESERHVLACIRQRYPEHTIVSEEDSPASASAAARWIVDPLDGTTNFVHGFPFFAVSIAFERDGQTEVGVVHAPALGETFHAIAGDGAFRNGERLRVSTTAGLIDSLLATGFPYDRWERADNNLGAFARLTMATQGVRRVGAASLDLAYVAAGRLDGYWEIGLKPWDVAAGALIVSEAGGCVTDYAGGPNVGSGAEIVATNGRLHDELLDALRRSKDGVRHSST